MNFAKYSDDEKAKSNEYEGGSNVVLMTIWGIKAIA
jgi:hypothetical protein